jgi:predicted amidohydrolase
MVFRVGIVQMKAVAGKEKDNLGRVLDKMKVLAALGVDLIVLPPLWATGFAFDGLNLLAPKALEFHAPLARFARENGAMIVHSLWKKTVDGYMQGYWLIDKTGETCYAPSKVHFNPTLKEDVFLMQGKELAVIDTPLTKLAIVSEADALKPNVIEDVCGHYAKMLIVEALCDSSAEGVLEAVLKARAIENQVFVVAAKHLGEYGDYKFLGGSHILDPFGQEIAKASKRDDFIHAEVNTDHVYRARRKVRLQSVPYTVVEVGSHGA